MSANNVSTHEVYETYVQSALVYLNIVVVVIATAVVVGNGVAVVVLMKCKRIPFQTKYISISLISSDALGAFVLIVYQVVIFMFGANTDVTQSLRDVTTGMVHGVNWCSVTFLSVDRAIAVKANLRYTELITRRTINTILFCIWIFYFTMIPALTFHGFQTVCVPHMDDNCDTTEATKVANSVVVLPLFMFGAVIICTNTYVYSVAQRHARQIADIQRSAFDRGLIHPDNAISERQFSATKTVVYIVLAFILLHAPLLIHYLMMLVSPDQSEQLPRRLYLLFAFSLNQLSSFVTLTLYAGKFMEFKMHLYFLLGKRLNRFNKRAQEIRVDVFNIVVSDESSNRNRVK